MTYARLAPVVLVLALVAPVVAEEAPPAPVELVRLGWTDPGRSLERLHAGLYGRAWDQPGVAPLRRMLAQRAAPLAQQLDYPDLAAVLAAVDGISLELALQDGGEVLAAAFLGGEAAPAVYRVLAGRSQPTTFEGAEEAVVAGDTIVARFAAGVAVGFEQAEPQVLPLVTGEDDLVATFAYAGVVDALAAEGVPADLVADLVAGLPVDWRLSLVAAGLDHRLAFPRVPVGLVAIDQALLARIPAQTGTVLALGVDAAAWWAETDRRLALAAAADPDAAADIERFRARVDAVLLMLGVEGGPAALCAELRGTVLTHLGKGAGLVPSLTIAIPRSPALDTVVTSALAMIGQDAPAEGALHFLRIPLGQRELQTLAPGVAVSRDAGHWLVGTDAILVGDWVAGATGGWLEQAAPRLEGIDLAATQVLGWGDTPAILRSALPMIGIASSQVRDAKLVEAGLELGLALARSAGTDLVVGAQAGDGAWTLRGHGPLGGLSLLLSPNLATTSVLAGLMLPAINMARQAARTANSQNNMKQLVLGCIAYQVDHDQQWPPSLDEMIVATGNEIPRKILTSPNGGGVEMPHYRYVWPTPNAKAMQPVILENPACQDGGKILVCFADGHVAIYRDDDLVQRLWQRAQELAAEAERTGLPIGPERWADLMDEL